MRRLRITLWAGLREVKKRGRFCEKAANETTNNEYKVIGLSGCILFTFCRILSMSKFTTPAILEMLGHYNWRVYEPFEFYLSDDNSDIISVPAGFITDLASVPRVFWTLLPPDGKYAKAAIIHDYLYDNALRTKKEADLIFLDGMTVLGVPRWKRTVMYWAVRLFGRGMYGKEQNTFIDGNR